MGIMLSITGGAMVKIAMLIAFACICNAAVRCMHDNFCKTCKK